MMKKILYTTLTLLSLVVGASFVQPAPAMAAATTPKDQICAGVNVAAGGKDCSGGDAQINNIVKVIITVFSIVVGVTAVIMIMVGGFKYITSAGDAGAISSAKKTIVYAIVGLVVVAFAQAIVMFVLNKI
ncbi:MAG TPA: hypothetical protein VLE73_05040 [Candidatus Saccharimonadales bacterium]|nr:hypothetical protein [Candidatus Saccharimonadales bacterium]